MGEDMLYGQELSLGKNENYRLDVATDCEVPCLARFSFTVCYLSFGYGFGLPIARIRWSVLFAV